MASTSGKTNRQWVLRQRHKGLIQPGDLELVETAIPDLKENEVLVRTVYLSLDPTNRTWMNDSEGYLPPVGLGEVMRGLTLGVEAVLPDGSLYDGLSVDIDAGERVGLVGRSGSGKTTFVKLVQRLYDVSGGKILIDGQDIAKATQQSLRSQIAIVQQEPILFHRTLAENIAYGRPGASMAAIEQAARLANAHDFIMRLPKDYGTLVGERGVKLSGGERQRVALARAFLADAPILILDEATSSLDSESEALIQQAMERLMKGRTSIVIAHRLSTVRSMDRILVFDRGQIVEQGTHEVLAARPGGIYRGLFERQATEFGEVAAE